MICTEGSDTTPLSLNIDRPTDGRPSRSRGTRKAPSDSGQDSANLSSQQGGTGPSSKYRHPYVEDIASMARENDRTKCHISSPSSNEAPMFRSEHSEKSSTISQLGLGQTCSYESQSDSSDAACLHEYLDGSVDLLPGSSRARTATRGKGHREPAAGHIRVEPHSLRSPVKNLQKLTRSTQSKKARGGDQDPASSGESATRHRSAFAGMHFRRRNQFGPPAFRGDSVDFNVASFSAGDGSATKEPTKHQPPFKLNTSPGAFSRGSRQDPVLGSSYHQRKTPPDTDALPGHDPHGFKSPYADDDARSGHGHGSFQSPPTSTYTTFIPASPNPYYTPQTSPSLFEEGIFERMGFYEARMDKNRAKMLYNPEPVTEEVPSVQDERVSPILLIGLQAPHALFESSH